MACVDKGIETDAYHRINTSVPVHPLRPSKPEPEELDTSATTPLTSSKPPQRKVGILRNYSTDSGIVSSPKKSHFNTVDLDPQRDSKAEVQTISQTTNAGDVRMDNSTDNGGRDKDDKSELNTTTTG